MLRAAGLSARPGRCAAGMLVLAAGLALLPGRGWSGPAASADLLPAVGGFLETAGGGVARSRLGLPEIQALLPARGAFLFPPPYGTEGVRLTNAGDCGGTDCVSYVGYSYWRNINNHAGRNEMQILLGLDRARGGPGPSLFAYDKTTGQVSNRGPLFDPASPPATAGSMARTSTSWRAPGEPPRPSPRTAPGRISTATTSSGRSTW